MLRENSDQLCKRIAQKSDGRCIISFSMGKDSIASYVQARKYFQEIYLVFYYMIPGLSFQEESLRYYEQKFGQRILRYPSVHFYNQLNSCMYQPPDRIDTLNDLDIFVPTYDEIFAAAKSDLGISQETYVGTGVRAADSLTRRMTITKHGAENLKRRQFFPVFDWKLEQIEAALRENDIRLPVDYKIWGRTFDGVQISFLEKVRELYPADYAKILDWFPLVDLDFLRFKDFADHNPFNL